MTDTITIPLATVQQALVTLEDVNPSLVCEMAHHPKKDQHGIGQKCPLEIRHLETIAAIKEALAQPPLPAQEQQQQQQQARVDVITVTLMREGINKHRARELADHFVNFTLTPPLPVQETVAWDKPSDSFNEWWNGDYDGSANPYDPDSKAHWAWAGWKAAQTVQEPVAWLYPEGLESLQNGKCWTAYPTEHEDCNIPLYTASPQRPWVGLTEQERNDIEDALGLFIGKPAFDAIETSLKERNT